MNITVCVMGLGNIGSPVVQHISKIYKQTRGYDISQEAIKVAKQNGIDASIELPYADIYVIAVNTWFRDCNIDMSAIEDCTKKAAKLNPNALICYESTLIKGTARNLAQKYNITNIAVCPHRWWKQEEDKHGVVQIRVLGALNKESQTKALDFYNALGIPTHIVSSLEIAEISKLVENTYYYLRIAYAQELKLLCDENNLNFNELRDAVNTKWNVDLAEARDGIGGECLPKDIRFLINAYPTAPLLRGAITSDIDYQAKVATKKLSLT
jgi:UDP-N-acetyl-D-mannosaminuronic acid dehydrogenase